MERNTISPKNLQLYEDIRMIIQAQKQPTVLSKDKKTSSHNKREMVDVQWPQLMKGD